MMNARPISEHRTIAEHVSGSGIRAVLSGLFLLLLCSLPARAGAVGGSNSNNDDSNGGSAVTSSPGDDVTSLPVTASETAGITLVGDLAELRSLDLTVQGQGRIDIVSLPRGGYAVTFVGSYVLGMDRAALARARVAVLFRSGSRFTDGRARLELGDSSSAFLAPRRLPLPMGRLAQSPAVQGDFLTLHLFGPNADQAHLVADFGAERVTLFQRLQ